MTNGLGCLESRRLRLGTHRLPERDVRSRPLAVVTELFRDWATLLAGPARDVINWYFTEVPGHTDQVGVAAAEIAATQAGHRHAGSVGGQGLRA